MNEIKLQIGDITGLGEAFKKAAETELLRASEDLAVQTYGHIVEQVQEKLHSSREAYLRALNMEQERPGVWTITLDPSANWIEDGMDRHEMIESILAGGKAPKIAKDGSRYKVIPFQLNRAPTRINQAGRDIQAALKSALKEREIAYGKLEKDEAGNPKIGKLHKLDIMDRPIKTAEGVGQGHGPIGNVRQGMTGIPFLKGVNIYQNLKKVKGTMVTQKDIMTFRIISSKHMGSGRWVHPGTPPRKFFDEAFMWCNNTWESKIKPAVIQHLQSRFGQR